MAKWEKQVRKDVQKQTRGKPETVILTMRGFMAHKMNERVNLAVRLMNAKGYDLQDHTANPINAVANLSFRKRQ